MPANDYLFHSRAIKSIQNEELIKGSDLINIIKDLARLRDIVDGLSGGGAITANHGRVAYVSKNGNNATGEVGNISKPYLTAGAAINGLTTFGGANPGTLIILSSASAVTISNYDYSSMVEELSIQVMCPVELIFAGDNCVFSTLNTISGNTITVDTTVSFAVVDSCNIQCNAFIIKSTSQGSFDYTGTINCNYLVVEDNVNIACNFGTANWKTGMSIGVIGGINYTDITPWEYTAVLNQTSTNAPVAVVGKNTLGEVPTYGYINPGDFTINSPGNKFIAGKTHIRFGLGFYDGVALAVIGQVVAPSTGTINFGSYSPNSVALANDLLVDTSINIEIYPEKY